MPCKHEGGTDPCIRYRRRGSAAVSNCIAGNRQYYARYHKKYPEYNLWHMARHRARIAGVPFTITLEYVRRLIVEYGNVCPALGTPFQRGIGRGPIPESMTLDRFDPAKGYVPGNVWLLSHKANLIKSSATRTEIGRVYKWMCEVIRRQEEKDANQVPNAAHPSEPEPFDPK